MTSKSRLADIKAKLAEAKAAKIKSDTESASASSLSTLTFNLSVSDKDNLVRVKEPFQIMPATQAHISNSTLLNYKEAHNENILCHMNYITRVFAKDAIVNNSVQRYSLSQYVKLATTLGTKDILIHMPESVDEFANIPNGIQIIYDEICSKGFHIHLEMPAWSKELQDLFNPDRQGNPIEYMSDYIEEVFIYCKMIIPDDLYHFVPDTAHMWANGCTKIEDFDYFFKTYKDRIKYIHLNGNLNVPFKQDTHVPILNCSMNKIPCSQEIVSICSQMKVICIAEVTKYGLDWSEWEKIAKENNMRLVKKNDCYAS